MGDRIGNGLTTESLHLTISRSILSDSKDGIAWRIDFESWEENHRHWVAPSYLEVHYDGTVIVYAKKLAAMYRGKGIIDGGPPCTFYVDLKFEKLKKKISIENDLGFGSTGLSYTIRSVIGEVRLNFDTLKYREERHEATITRKYPNLMQIIEISDYLDVTRGWINDKRQDAVIIPLPSIGF